MKLLDACHWLAQKRRWLILPGVLLASALLGLLLGARAFAVLASPAVFAAGMLAIYRMAQRRFRTPGHLRMPAPRDARAEVVLVDASLIDGGKRVMAAAQPVNAMPNMSLRMGSGAILLGTAMVLLSREAPQDEGDALLRAAADLKLQPDALRRKNPVLDAGMEDGMRRITVQDGSDERSYFMGSAAAVATACVSIWEGSLRPMRQSDRERILDTESYMMAGKCRVYAFATAEGTEKPTFLGLAGIGSQLDMDAIRQLNELRGQGLTLALRDDGVGDADVNTLRRTLGIADLHARPDICLSSGNPCHEAGCLTVVMAPDQPLAEPVEALREHFAALWRYMQGVGTLLALCLAACMLAGGWTSPLWAAGLLAVAVCTFGRHIPRWKRWTLAIPLAICLLARLLLASAVPESASAAGTCLCIGLTAASALILMPKRMKWGRTLPMAGAALVGAAIGLVAIPAAAAGFALLTGLLAGTLLTVLNK